jgi:hypothetical protein
MNPLQEPRQDTQPLLNIPVNTNGYTQLSLPSLLPTDIRILSHNIKPCIPSPLPNLVPQWNFIKNWIPQSLEFKNVIKIGASTPQQKAPFL